MRTVNVDVAAECTAAIPIGIRGETEATQVVFDVSSLEETFGAGTIVFHVKNHPTASPYPVAVDYADSAATWTVSSVDTQFVGMGKCELSYYVDDTLAKSIVYRTRVEADIGLPSSVVPDPYDTWLDVLSDLAADTQLNAQAAAASATDAETAQGLAEDARDAANQAKLDAQTAQGLAETAQDNAEGFANSSSASATLSESWAVGGTGTRTGEDSNNSKYWAELAEQHAEDAGFILFHIDSAGHLIYTKTETVDLVFSLSNGHLFVEVAN